MGRPIEGTMKNLTIVKEAGLWYASIQVEIEKNIVVHPKIDVPVGIDMGIKQFATLSNGHVIEPISVYRAYQNKLAIWQQKLARRQKGSSGWKQAKYKIQDLHEKIRRIRQDFLHKATTWIANNHGIVVLEYLKVSNLSRSAKGTVDDPGRNVKAKSGLNKSILDQGWYAFRLLLEYKLLWSGGILHLVPPHYTSQRCSECGHVAAENRVSQSLFKCVSCHYTANADENAAKNILSLAPGHGVTANESNSVRDRKLEPRKKRKGKPSFPLSESSSLAC